MENANVVWLHHLYALVYEERQGGEQTVDNEPRPCQELCSISNLDLQPRV